jgi:O-antigen ligase
VALLVGLATLASIGTIWEYRTDYNVFYDLAKKLFSSFAAVDSVPTPSGDSRDETFGPTQHGLAITMMLTFALPFGVMGILAARTRGRKLLYGIAVALIFTAAISTQRKTSVIAPAAALLVLCVYRPGQMLRLAPLALVMLVGIHLMAPAALGGVASQLTGGFFESGTTIGRTSDYEAIAPDIATHPLLGRGYGTIDPTRSDTYRILDNQYLSHVLQIGYLGLAAYLALIITAMALAHGVIRRARRPDHQHMALAAMAGFGAFAVANALFDLLSFGQVTYLFCFIAGLCSIAAVNREPALTPVPALVPTR